VLTHSHTHTRTHALTRTHTHTHTDITHAPAKHTPTPPHTHTQTHTRTPTHGHTHTNARAHTHTHTRTYTHGHNTRARQATHLHTLAHGHEHTRAHTRNPQWTKTPGPSAARNEMPHSPSVPLAFTHPPRVPHRLQRPIQTSAPRGARARARASPLSLTLCTRRSDAPDAKPGYYRAFGSASFLDDKQRVIFPLGKDKYEIKAGPGSKVRGKQKRKSEPGRTC